MIDICVNLASNQFETKRLDIVKTAFNSGVTGMVLTSTNLKSTLSNISFLKENSRFNLVVTAGVHPHWSNSWDETSFETFKNICQSNKVCAVGETGLDFNRMLSSSKEQNNCFDQQLAIALDCDKPVFLHCRNAWNDFISQVLPFCKKGGTGVVHCFTGTKNQSRLILDAGLDIGLTGWICQKRGENLASIIKTIPLSRIHIETDSPYLHPDSLKTLNEPKNLYLIALKLANILNLPIEKIIEETSLNSKKLFKLN